MKPEMLEQILGEVSDGRCSVQDALIRLRRWPVEELGFAQIDHHRHLRRGIPEVIFAIGKRPEETERIAQALVEGGSPLLVTRASEETRSRLLARFPDGRVNADARTFSLRAPDGESQGRVVVMAAGTSDRPVAEEAAETARAIGAEVTTIYDVGIAGLHRLTPYLEVLEEANAIVVIAGMEGALASVVGGLVATPVVAVPTSVGYGANFGGLSALLGMLTSCASGVVVVNIDNGFGGGFAAALINRSIVAAEQRGRKQQAASHHPE
ncbi:MAG: nickel pincer cofactor biosynthesis protein LarB [Candidatus Eisenbacteria sp.]|nr:nickel pincer cofactor biosynthesis protein LarB [Candidatus Eisenbacteria bacterium]